MSINDTAATLPNGSNGVNGVESSEISNGDQNGSQVKASLTGPGYNGFSSQIGIEKVLKDVDFDPKFKYFTAKQKRVNLRFENIKLKIGNKDILNGITGQVPSGMVCALMGPSGAGKSSLLNSLAGRILPSRKKQLSGKVLVNEVEINPVEYRKNIAYVMQEDLLYVTATARECLEFSARLRLPVEVSTKAETVKKIVDDLLESLGLTHVQNTMVGSELVRGLSGGEKKRVAIGVEVITNPSLLFLDEPTSGLDSFSAWKVVKILRALGKATGCAILCTIHQPSSEIFSSFSNVMMLCRGSVMYNGKVRKLPTVFEQLKRPIPPMSNPADFIVLLAQTITDDSRLPHYNIDDEGEKAFIVVDDEDEMEKEKEDEELSDIDRVITAGACTQSFWLARRELRNVKRDYFSLLIGIIISGTLFSIFGLIFFDVADRTNPDYTVQDVFGGIILIISSTMFSAAQGPLLTFPLERGIFLREYSTGTYGALPYLMAKILVEIPRSAVVPSVALTIAYFTIGFSANYFVLLGVVWVLSLAIASYAVALGAAVSNPESAQQFSSIILVPQLLFGGLFISVSSIPDFISWAQYICVLKYGLNLALIAELGDCEPDEETELLHPDFFQNCTFLLQANDVDQDLVYRDIGIIIGVFLLFRTLSLVFLVIRARYNS